MLSWTLTDGRGKIPLSFRRSYVRLFVRWPIRDAEMFQELQPDMAIPAHLFDDWNQIDCCARGFVGRYTRNSLWKRFLQMLRLPRPDSLLHSRVSWQILCLLREHPCGMTSRAGKWCFSDSTDVLGQVGALDWSSSSRWLETRPAASRVGSSARFDHYLASSAECREDADSRRSRHGVPWGEEVLTGSRAVHGVADSCPIRSEANKGGRDSGTFVTDRRGCGHEGEMQSRAPRSDADV